MSLTRALVVPLNAVILAPSLRRSLTRLFWATPLILAKLPPANTCRAVGGNGQRLDLAVEDRGEGGVDRPGGGVEGEDVAPGDRRRRRGRAGDPVELAAGGHLVADLDDGGDLAVEHLRRPVRRIARHHRGLRGLHRGAGRRQQPDQDGGRHRSCGDHPSCLAALPQLQPGRPGWDARAMPELPEAERAREALERHALGRVVADADDSDSYVCRPWPPGGLREALVGHRVTGVDRVGKQLLVETDGPGLRLHRGMSGSLRFDGPEPRFKRFALAFTDGGTMVLRDPRRLARVTLDPARGRLGPAALEVPLARFRDLG